MENRRGEGLVDAARVLPDAPALSLVIPVYNVAKYLDACLRSVVSQGFDDIEVILVDDGSTDGSRDICDDWVARDPRFQLIVSEHRGPGAARNLGIDAARGKYLSFLDSDDITPVGAFRRMYDTLEQTGSSLVSGSFERLLTSGTRPVNYISGVYDRELLKTNVHNHPQLVKDGMCWNKMWRLSFLRQAAVRFPEDILYEDIATVIPAYFQAESIDILSDTVGLWRIREGERDSITQSRAKDVKQFHDRISAVSRVMDVIRAGSHENILALYINHILSRDIRYFIDSLLQAEEDTQKGGCHAIADFVDKLPPNSFADLPALLRAKYRLVSQRDLPGLMTLLECEKSGALADIPYIRSGEKFFLDWPGKPASILPEAIDVTDELRIRSTVTAVSLTRGRLVIEGAAGIYRVDREINSAAAISLYLKAPTGLTIPCRLTPVRDSVSSPRLDSKSAHNGLQQFRASVYLPRYLRKLLSLKEFALCISVEGAGRVISGQLTHPIAEIAATVQRTPLSPLFDVRTRWLQNKSLELRVVRRPLVVSSARVEGSHLVLGMARQSLRGVTTLALEPVKDAGFAPHPVLTARLRGKEVLFPLEDIVGLVGQDASETSPGQAKAGVAERTFALVGRKSNGTVRVALDSPPTFLDVGNHHLRLRPNRLGNAVAIVGPATSSVVSATLGERGLVLELAGVSAAQLKSVSLGRADMSCPADFIDHIPATRGVRAGFHADTLTSFFGRSDIPAGIWDCMFTVTGQDSRPIEVSVNAEKHLPLTVTGNGVVVTALMRRGRRLAVSVSGG